MDYIEHNPRHSYQWLVVDIDHDDALLRIENSRLPAPNMVVVNPKNGHAHAFWLLEKEVYRSGKARWGPAYYFKAVWRGFTRRLGGDMNYVQLITKNPHSSRWKTLLTHSKAFSLEELDCALEHEEKVKEKSDRRVQIEDGAGRNVALFNTLRIEAYRKYAAYLRGASKSSFYEWIEARAEEINNTFLAPLDWKEINYTLQSIIKYCEKNIKANHRDESFSEAQRRRVNIRWEKWRKARMKMIPAKMNSKRIYILIGIKKEKKEIMAPKVQYPVTIPVGSYGSVKDLLQYWPPE